MAECFLLGFRDKRVISWSDKPGESAERTDGFSAMSPPGLRRRGNFFYRLHKPDGIFIQSATFGAG